MSGPALRALTQRMQARGGELDVEEADAPPVRESLEGLSGMALAAAVGELVAFAMWLKQEGAQRSSDFVLGLAEETVPRLREVSVELADAVKDAVAGKAQQVTGAVKASFEGKKQPAEGQVGAGPLARFQLLDDDG